MAAGALTEQDVVEIRTETAAARPVTVWFTAAAVGVPAGRSAKVLSVDDVAEGDFIQVRAAGSKDTMFCSPGELTRIRPPRKKPAPQAAAPAPEAVTPKAPSPAPGATRNGTGASGSGGPSAAPAAAPAPLTPSTGTAAARKPAGSGVSSSGVSGSGAGRATAKITDGAASTTRAAGTAADRGTGGGSVSTDAETAAKPRATRRTAAKPAEVTVTLSSTEEGEWTVEVVVGKKRAVKPTPVQPGDVAVAAKALPPDVAEAIESTLEAARLRQRDRVERLRAELEAAQKVLDDLDA